MLRRWVGRCLPSARQSQWGEAVDAVDEACWSRAPPRFARAGTRWSLYRSRVQEQMRRGKGERGTAIRRL